MIIPDAWGIPFLDVVSLCWIAYHEQATAGSKWQFHPSGSVWTVKHVYKKGPFRAALVQGPKLLVLSFAGTNELRDWIDNISQGLTGVSGQYIYALETAKQSPCQMVVGHSLGGGLASFVAIHTGKHAATVNPAALNIFIPLSLPNALLPGPAIPNIPNLTGIIRKGSRVINYVVLGEALDILDRVSYSMTRVGRIIPVSSRATDPISKHSLAHIVGFKQPTRS